MPQLTIPEDTFRRLSERAAALKISVEELVKPALDRLLETDTVSVEVPRHFTVVGEPLRILVVPATDPPTIVEEPPEWSNLSNARTAVRASETRSVEEPQPLTGDAWRAELEAWKRDAESRVGRYPPGFVLDDSRETVYREREDAQL
jgi:hypothetical protein